MCRERSTIALARRKSDRKTAAAAAAVALPPRLPPTLPHKTKQQEQRTFPNEAQQQLQQQQKSQLLAVIVSRARALTQRLYARDFLDLIGAALECISIFALLTRKAQPHEIAQAQTMDLREAN